MKIKVKKKMTKKNDKPLRSQRKRKEGVNKFINILQHVDFL
ncbi:hypothetical protein ES705_13866 [subsurface metagenome]